ncbi:hypothetical protein SCALM49S_06988 [Streptomyces californicus]
MPPPEPEPPEPEPPEPGPVPSGPVPSPWPPDGFSAPPGGVDPCSLPRSVSSCAAFAPACLAVLCTAGRTRANHASSSASSAASTISSHLGRTGIWANSPGSGSGPPGCSSSVFRSPAPVARTSKGQLTGSPNQISFRARALSPNSADSPGSSRLVSGAKTRRRSSPSCRDARATSTGVFPRFCTAVRNRAPSQPRRRRGSSSARSSWKGSTVTVDSGTTTELGSLGGQHPYGQRGLARPDVGGAGRGEGQGHRLGRARIQRHTRRLHGGPGGAVADHFEGVGLDDVTVVAHGQSGRRGAARRHRHRGACEFGRCGHAATVGRTHRPAAETRGQRTGSRGAPRAPRPGAPASPARARAP